MKLFDCLGKHGKIFTPAERADLLAVAKSNVEDGLTAETAELAAVEEALTEAKADLQETLDAIEATTAAPTAEAVEPWTLTRAQYVDSFKGQRIQKTGFQNRLGTLQNAHADAVDTAVQVGKPVPEEVLAEYPEIVRRYARFEQPNPEPAVAEKPAEESATERKRARVKKAMDDAEDRALAEEAARAARDKLVEEQAEELKRLGVIKEEPAFSRANPQTETPEFKAWFGDSKVVDANGKPLVVYHGTVSDFSEFSMEGRKYLNGFSTGGAAWFTPSPEKGSWASGWLPEMRGEAATPSVYPVYLSLKNPAIFTRAEMVTAMPNGSAYPNKGDIQRFKESGFDGIVVTETGRIMDASEILAFHPEQIKSSIGNRGTFDANNRDIRFSRAPAAAAVADSIRAQIEPILKAWPNAPAVRVIASMAEAPQAMRLMDNAMRSTGASGVPEAFIYKNAVYLVADGLTPGRVYTALFHESLGHFGLRGTFGEKLNPILDRVAFDFKDRVAAKAAEYGLDVNTESGRRQAAEEVLAELAQTRPELGVVKRLIAAIRQFLRDIGIDLKLSDSDVVANYILPARGFVERGRASPAGEPVPAFSRAAAALPASTFASARTLFDNITRSDRVLNRVISKFNTPFHIAETHPEFKPVYEEAQDYNQDVSRVANETADLAPDLLPRIEGFSDFKKSAPSNEDIATTANALYAGTLWGGGSPLEGRVWSDEELRTGRARDGNITIKAFDPVSEPQIKLYRQALASVGHSMTEHAKSLVWRLAKQKDIRLPMGSSLAQMVAVSDDLAATQIEGKRDRMKGADDETRARAEAEVAELDAFRQALKDIQAKTDGLISHGYFPSMRFGQYAVNVQTMDANGKWKEEFFGRYETQTAANLAKAELLKEYPDATSRVTSGVMNDDAHKLFQGLNLDALELFSDHMRSDDGKPISADPIMQEYFRVAVTERSTLKRQIHRKGTPGFSRDVPRALAQFTVSNATSASRNYHAADMLAKVQKIKAGDLQAYATRYVSYLQDPQEESPALRGFLANYYILGSIAFGAVNMTQPVLMTAPYLSQYTSWPKAMAQLGRAAKDLVTGRKDLTPDEQAAYARAAKAGIVSPQEIHQIRAESRASMMGDSPLWQKLEAILAERGMKLPGKLLMRKAAFLWGSIYSMTEQFNRGTTFLAAYRVGKEKGEDAYTFAKNSVDATQGVYARSNRPEVSRGVVGSTIMTFKQFSIAYLELAKRLYDHDKKAFAVLMLTLMALAGAEGLPFAEDVEDLIDTIGQWMGYPTNAKKALRKRFVEMLGPDIADILLHGASAIPGVPIDVSNRLGMHNIIPGSALLKTSEPDKTRDIIDLLGPAAGLFKNTGTAIEGLATGQPGDTKLLLPSALQNVMKAAEMVDTGTYRDTKGRKVMNVDVVDAFSKLIGFQPAKVARETRLVGQNQQDIALHRVIEDSIASKWAHGTVDKDPGMVADAVRQWKDWNATNPEMPVAITGAQIARRIKELQMSREERFIKSAPKEIRGDVARDVRQ